MDEQERYLKRWVRLCNIRDNVKLNGAHAEVISYSSEDETFEVKLCCNGTDTSKCVRVQRSNLVLHPDFEYRFPQAPVIKYWPEMLDFPDGVVVIDFTGQNPELSLPKPDEVIVMNHSCKFKGDGMRIGRSVWIDLKENETDVAEFVGIHFKPVQYQKQTINCVRGWVFFRSCSFSYNPIGVNVGPKVWAIFENCSFQECKECGVQVEGDNTGRVSFINCRFNNNGIGVWVGEEALVDVAGCTIAGCIGGVLLPYFAQCYVRHTTFDNMEDYCVLASNRSEIDFRDCVIKGCKGDGLVYEAGGIDSTCVAEDSIINNCRAAVRTGNGKVDVVLKELDINICSIGIYIAADTVGSVNFDECVNGTDCKEDFIHLGSDKCRVVWDEIDLNERFGPQLGRLIGYRPRVIKTGIKYGYPVSAFTKQMLHKTGIASIQCANCKVIPAADAWFKKCSECREARYCSRDCQRAHYKAHRVECFVTTVKAYEMSTRGYICCMHCGTVESETSGKQHKACSQCLAVFYCSRKCQVANWKEHKTSCKQHFS